jgi:hypothetical protein
MARRPDSPTPAGGAPSAVAQVIGADACRQFRPRGAGRTQGVAQEIIEPGRDEGGVAGAGGLAEVRRAQAQDLRDVGFGGLGEIEMARQALGSRPRSAM